MPSFSNSLVSAFGAVSEGLNTVSKLSSIANNLSNPNKLMGAIRSFNLPLGGESVSKMMNASASFAKDTSSDWRARLTMLDGSFFDNAPVLDPIKNADKSLIFPYTPSINISASATYADQPITHSNYQFTTYTSSKVSEITVVGDFPVEDAEQAAYWIAVVHFLRSVTKMYTGNTGDANPGNPPPVLNFSAYGDFVFKNVPVVVTSFSLQLPKEVDYIAVNTLKNSNVSSGTSNLNKISSAANIVAGGLSAFGQTKAAGLLKTGTNLINAVSGPTSSSGGQGSGNESHVPTNSSLTVSLKPIYSREKIRNFSLNTFVKGGYVGQGYL